MLFILILNRFKYNVNALGINYQHEKQILPKILDKKKKLVRKQYIGVWKYIQLLIHANVTYL